MFRRFISTCISITFIWSAVTPIPAQAQAAVDLPVPGTMVSLSAKFDPILLKGLTVNPKDPFAFDFIIDPGHNHLSAEDPSLKEETNTLIKYFLTALTVPEKNLWVNLSPYEKDRMMANDLGQTQMGQDMLAQDYILKQLTASLIYPEKALGKVFWDKVYAKARQMYGTTEVPVNTFNKVWIVADRADVYRRGNTAYVVGAHLKVMLEEDYDAMQKSGTPPDKMVPGTNLSNNAGSAASDIVREVVLPEIEKEVNAGKNFAPLRQMFYSMILASWYKKELQDSMLVKVYANKGKVQSGVNAPDINEKHKIFERYLQAYKKGVFNYIKEAPEQNGQPRKYFSGGLDYAMLQDTIHTLNVLPAGITLPSNAMVASVQTSPQDNAMMNNEDLFVEISRSLMEKPVVLLVEPKEYWLLNQLKNDLVVAGYIVKSAIDMKEAKAILAQDEEEETSKIGLVILDHPEMLAGLEGLVLDMPVVISPQGLEQNGLIANIVLRHDIVHFVKRVSFFANAFREYRNELDLKGYSKAREEKLLSDLVNFGGLDLRHVHRIADRHLEYFTVNSPDKKLKDAVIFQLHVDRELKVYINNALYGFEWRADGNIYVSYEGRIHRIPKKMFIKLGDFSFKNGTAGRVFLRPLKAEKVYIHEHNEAMTSAEKLKAINTVHKILFAKKDADWKETAGKKLLSTFLFHRPLEYHAESIEDVMVKALQKALDEINDDNIFLTSPIAQRYEAVTLNIPNDGIIRGHVVDIYRRLRKYAIALAKEVRLEADRPTRTLIQQRKAASESDFETNFESYFRRSGLKAEVTAKAQPNTLEEKETYLPFILKAIASKATNPTDEYSTRDAHLLIKEALKLLNKPTNKAEEDLVIYLQDVLDQLDKLSKAQHRAFLKEKVSRNSPLEKLAEALSIDLLVRGRNWSVNRKKNAAMATPENIKDLRKILLAKTDMNEWKENKPFAEGTFLATVVIKRSGKDKPREEVLIDLLRTTVNGLHDENIFVTFSPSGKEIMLNVPLETTEQELKEHIEKILAELKIEPKSAPAKKIQPVSEKVFQKWPEAYEIIDILLEQVRESKKKPVRDHLNRVVLLDPKKLPTTLEMEDALKLTAYLVDQWASIFHHSPTILNSRGAIVLEKWTETPALWSQLEAQLKAAKKEHWDIKRRHDAYQFKPRPREEHATPVFFKRNSVSKQVRILDQNGGEKYRIRLTRNGDKIHIYMEGEESVNLGQNRRSSGLWDLPFDVFLTASRYVLFKNTKNEVFYIEQGPEEDPIFEEKPSVHKPFYRSRFLSSLKTALRYAENADNPGSTRMVQQFLRQAINEMGSVDASKEGLARFLDDSVILAKQAYDHPTHDNIKALTEKFNKNNSDLKKLLQGVGLKMDAAQTTGGIDLDASKMALNISSDETISPAFDQRMLENLEKNGFSGLEFHIKSLTPADLPVLLGL
jgi:hypothetical protein